MSIIGLAVYTLLFAEFAYALSTESEDFYGPSDDPAVRTQDVEAISTVLAGLSTSISSRLAEIDSISLHSLTDSNESDIIAMASRSKLLADELVVVLAPLESVTPILTRDSMQTSKTVWEQGRQAALQARLNDMRESLPRSLAQYHRCRNASPSSQRDDDKMDGLQRSGPTASPFRHLIDCSLNSSFSTNLYMCKAYLSVAKQYPGILSKIDLAEALRFGQLAELECQERPEDVHRKALLDKQLAEFDRICRFLNGTIRVHSETFAGRALIYYITTHVSRAEKDELENHHIPSRMDSAHVLPDFEQTLDNSKPQPAQAIDTSEDWSFDIAYLLQRENGVALSLVMQQYTGSNSKSGSMFNDSKSLVELLLRSGASPNQTSTTLNEPTPFEYLAIHYSKAIKDPVLWAQWIDLLPTFLQHGASMSTLFTTSSTRPCWFTRLFHIPSEHTKSVQVFSILFSRGLDPNNPYQTSTIWSFFLQNILANRIWNPQGVREYNSRTSQIYQTAKLFLEHSASLSCRVNGSQEECKFYKQAWEALWPYGQDMQMLLMETKDDAKPAALLTRVRRKEAESGGSGVIPTTI
ncbi:hypothetical protein E6O75_ATG00890 [Venturia nashicola]|uniref:Uncharacterized protein n=1 Tax=Venturia nashicola TaxID=86259 RepID=A0A4Z1PT04_9PEZI|nr:hypothetical protein E6O75_ATG00890 [Venturia nashicola]